MRNYWHWDTSCQSNCFAIPILATIKIFIRRDDVHFKLGNTSKHHNTTRIGGWLTATAVAGVAVLGIMIIPRMWDGTSSQHQPDQNNDFLSKNFMEDEAPWHENLDMLQNMDFTLWLDMAEPEEDAG